MSDRALQAIIAVCAVGAAVMAVWAFSQATRPPRRPPEEVAAAVRRLTQEPPIPAPVDRPRRGAARRPPPSARPSGVASAPVFAPSGSPPPATAPGQTAGTRPAMRAEEVAVQRVLDPLIARRPNAAMAFVRCLDPGGWRQPGEGEGTEAAGEDPLDVPARDSAQPVCRAQLRARAREDLVGLLKDASTAYGGHLVGNDPREHLDGYLGHWWEAEVQVDTQDPYPPPGP